jgi:hypothetical protein
MNGAPGTATAVAERISAEMPLASVAATRGSVTGRGAGDRRGLRDGLRPGQYE